MPKRQGDGARMKCAPYGGMEKSQKPVDNSFIYAKIFKILQRDTKKKQPKTPGAKRGQWEPSGGIRCGPLSCGLRDQDGGSRYRAAKMRIFRELGWYHDLVVPIFGGGFLFLGGYHVR